MPFPELETPVEIPQESPSFLPRAGEGLANAPSNLINSMLKGWHQLGGLEGEEAVSVPTPYDIPQAKGAADIIADIPGMAAETIPLFLGGEFAAAKLAQLTKAGPVLANMMKLGGGFAAQRGVDQTPEQAGVEAGLGGLYGAAEKLLPRPARLLAAAASGIATGLVRSHEGATTGQSVTQGIIAAGLPILTGGRIKAAPIVEAPPLRLGYRGAGGRLLEDVQHTRPVEGTGGPIPYGGELEESTTRAKPVLGSDRVDIRTGRLPKDSPFRMGENIIEGEFVDVPNGTHLLPAPNPTARGLVAEPAMTMLELMRGRGGGLPLNGHGIPPEGSLIREPAMTMEELMRGRRQVATLQPREPIPPREPLPAEIAAPRPPVEPKPPRKPVAPIKLAKIAGPALIDEKGEVIIDGVWGVDTHATLFDRAMTAAKGNAAQEDRVMAAFTNDAQHAFLDANKRVVLRDEAGTLADKFKQREQGWAGKPLQSQHSIKEQPEVATLQSEKNVGASPESAAAQVVKSSPSSVETAPLPQGVSIGDKVIAKHEGADIVGTLMPTQESGYHRILTHTGEEVDVLPRTVKPLAKKAIDPNIEHTEGAVPMGDLSDIAAAMNPEKANTIKLRGGGKMKKSNFGEQGFITNETISALARYGVAPAIGAAVGYAEDDQHRLGSAIAGAVAGGLVGHYGGKFFRLLAEGHPEIKASKSSSERLSKLNKAFKDDFIKGGKAVFGSEEMAKKAVSRAGIATGWERMARWVQANATVDLDATRLKEKAYGLVEVSSNAIKLSLATLSKIPGIKAHHESLSKYFSGEISHAEFMRAVPKEIADLAASAKQTTAALQNIIINALGTGKLSATIQKSIGNYMTTTYRIFHDAKYYPTDAQVESAARSLSSEWGGTLHTRITDLHAYIHEAKATKGLFTNAARGGEALTAILARSKDSMTPEFIEMLGKYENPLERMGFTAMKLVNAARSGEFMNEVARGTKENGLKFAYSRAEWEAKIATLQHEAKYNYTPEARAAAEAKLADVKTYVPNAHSLNQGKLSGLYVDLRMRDQLANYDSAYQMFSTPLGRGFANATNLIKYGQVILSPLQFTRQVFQMPILGMMSKTLPTDWLKSFKVLTSKDAESVATLQRLRTIGVMSGDPVGGMLHRDMKAMMDGTLDGFLHSRVGNALHTWEEIWRAPDQIVRMSSFMRKEAELLAQGMAPELAEARAINHMNRYTMNYGAVPPIVMKGRQLPFINQYLSFSYEMLRITKNLSQDALKGDPWAIGTLATLATAPFIIQQMSEQALSPADRAEWNRVKNLGPAYDRHGFKFVQGKLPNGDFRYLSFSPLVLHDPYLRTLRSVMAGDKEAAFAANPVFGWENTPLLNVASTFDTGRNRHSGDQLYTVADYADAVRKDIAPLLLGTDLDRIKDALTRNVDGTLGVMNLRTGRSNSIGDILQTYLSSMRPYTLRPMFVQQQATLEARDRIRQQQITARRVFSSNASEEVKARARDNFSLAVQHILLSYQEQLGANRIQPDTVQP